MKNSILFIVISLLSIQCSSQKTNFSEKKEYDDLIKAKVIKIDSTENAYIYYIKNSNISAVFPVSKYCNNLSYKKRIKENLTYSFELIKEKYAGKQMEIESNSFSIDDKKIWDSSMKGLNLYIDCYNVCGKYIK